LESRLISQIIQDAIQGSGFSAPLHNSVLLSLRSKGKVLSGEQEPQWPAFVLATSKSVSGNAAAATRIAAAIEILVTALDVLDEVEDGDVSDLINAVGSPRAINTSTALLALGYSVLSELHRDGVAFERIPTFIHAISSSIFCATVGQDADLSIELQQASVSTVHNVARMKAGSLVGGACRLGAMTGSNETTVLDMYESWGIHYGIMAQFANDLHDASDTINKSDYKMNKGTLPLVFHRASKTGVDGFEFDEKALWDDGTYHFVWTAIEAERQLCQNILSELAASGFIVDELARLLP
jgi:geranylgeranyl diphosphate synthase type I